LECIKREKLEISPNDIDVEHLLCSVFLLWWFMKQIVIISWSMWPTIMVRLF